MNPQFTVLIAAYNAAAFLPKCLASLQAQTLADFEAVCIDDASSDATLALLRQCAAADARFRVVSLSENGGAAAARRAGLRQARGEWVVMLDADDWFAPSTLERLAAAAKAYPQADSLIMNLILVDENGEEKGAESFDGTVVFSGKDAFVRSINWEINGVAAVRRELALREQPESAARLFGDDLISRIHYFRSRQVVQTDAPYYYLQHALSATHAPSTRRLLFLRTNDEMRGFIEKNGVGEEAERRCEFYNWKIYIGVWRQMHALLPSLTKEERLQVRQTLRSHFLNIRPERLSRRVRWGRHTLYLRPYALWCAWQRTLIFFRNIFRKR